MTRFRAARTRLVAVLAVGTIVQLADIRATAVQMRFAANRAGCKVIASAP